MKFFYYENARVIQAKMPELGSPAKLDGVIKMVHRLSQLPSHVASEEIEDSPHKEGLHFVLGLITPSILNKLTVMIDRMGTLGTGLHHYRKYLRELATLAAEQHMPVQMVSELKTPVGPSPSSECIMQEFTPGLLAYQQALAVCMGNNRKDFSQAQQVLIMISWIAHDETVIDWDRFNYLASIADLYKTMTKLPESLGELLKWHETPLEMRAAAEKERHAKKKLILNPL